MENDWLEWLHTLTHICKYVHITYLDICFSYVYRAHIHVHLPISILCYVYIYFFRIYAFICTRILLYILCTCSIWWYEVCMYISLYIYIYIVYILLTVDSTHLQKMNNNNNSTSSCSHQPAAGCSSPSLLKVFPGFRLQGFASTTCFRHRCGCQGSLGRDGGWMMFWTQVGCRGCFFLFVFLQDLCFACFVFVFFCFLFVELG